MPLRSYRRDLCDCGEPATASGRCRSCAAKLANQTRKRDAFARALMELDKAREAEERAEKLYEDARAALVEARVCVRLAVNDMSTAAEKL